MARVVYKYPLVFSVPHRRCEVSLPKGSEILHIDHQKDAHGNYRLFLWAETNSDWEASEAPTTIRRFFETYSTGQTKTTDDIPNSQSHHCKTILYGPYVWHIYERVYDAGHEPQGTSA
jgi:hypothetical protein